MTLSDCPRVLSIMAHPDDSEILAGGTLIQLREREWGVGLVTMTAGNIGSISPNYTTALYGQCQVRLR